MTGMIERLFRFEIFDCGIFFVWLHLSGELNRDFLGFENNLKIRSSARESTTKLVLRVVYIFNVLHCACFIKPVILSFLEIFNLAWDFWGVNF